MPIGVYEHAVRPLEERFWARVNIPAETDGCWEWDHPNGKGYGKFWLSRGRLVYAHRVAYELLVGPIPDGLVIDHLCRNRACVFVEHLEPVSGRENILRGVGFGARNTAKTSCPSGHEYRVSKRGKRYCQDCHRQQRALRRAGRLS